MPGIELTFPDASKHKFKPGTTGFEVAKSIGEGLAKAAVGVKLDQELLDLHRPLSVSGAFEVITHVELIQDLIASGKIQLPHEIKSKIVYHDACYLGRYNKIYNPPREVVKSLKGVTTTEMHRCRDKGFCCGAGGGRMWVEEVRGTRINENRVEEAAALNPNVIATACPYCLIQIGDGVKTKNLEGKIRTQDIAELVVEAMDEVQPKNT